MSRSAPSTDSQNRCGSRSSPCTGTHALLRQAALADPRAQQERLPASGRRRHLGHAPRAPEQPEKPIAAGAAGFAAFSLLGLFSALAPTFLGSVMHEQSHAIQGAVVFGMFAAGTLTQLLAFRVGSRGVVLAGLGLFLAGLGLIVAALAQAQVVLFLAGTVVAGAAVGAVFLGSLATANRLAPPWSPDSPFARCSWPPGQGAGQKIV